MPPSAPANVKAEATNVGITVTWSENVTAEQVTEYRVFYCKTSNGSYTQLGSSTVPEFNYISSLTNGFFRVYAINDAGESASSETVEVK